MPSPPTARGAPRSEVEARHERTLEGGGRARPGDNPICGAYVLYKSLLLLNRLVENLPCHPGWCVVRRFGASLRPRRIAPEALYRYTLFDMWSPLSHRWRVACASAWRSWAICAALGASRVNSRSIPFGSLI